MKAFFSFFLIVSSLLTLSCQQQINIEGEEGDLLATGLVIRSGTSFGMCRGYCLTQLEITEQTTTFQQESLRDTVQYPLKQCVDATNQNNWQAIRQSVDWAAFQALPDTIGCPDCADGGAEWIEIEEGNKKYRVTFEYKAKIPQIQPLLDQVRSIRNQAKQACP